MASKPKNIPTLGEYIYPDLTPEENAENFKRAQYTLILIMINYLTKKREKNNLKTELNHHNK